MTQEDNDLQTPNIFINKIISDGALTVRIAAHHPESLENNLEVEILEIHWDRLGTYVDVGKTYPLTKDEWFQTHKIDDMCTWQIEPQHLKRTACDLILAWQKDIGWCWDLDA